MSSELDCDLVVIGAGLAGLSAAHAAIERGASVVVLEARDRVGGRLLNHELSSGHVVEIGGQWIGPSQLEVNALVDRLGLERFTTYNEGFNQFDYRGRLRPYKGAIPKLNPAILADIAQAQARLDRMARKVPLEDPWNAAAAEKWDGMTMATWLRKGAHSYGARAFLQMLCEAVWAVHPADLSLLHFLFYVHSAGGIDKLISTDGGAQQDRIVGGSQSIALRLAEEIADHIKLSAPVEKIKWSDDSVLVSAEGLEVHASRAIVAIPPTLAGRLRYLPALPGSRDQLTQRVPQGSVVKCMAVYERPFWREQGFTGQVTSDRGPVKVTFDNSPPDGSVGVLLGFLEGNQARRYGRLDEAERRAEVIRCFARYFGADASRPVEYVDKVWADEEYSRGCYGGFMPPGVWTSFGADLRQPIGPIHWAGAETATVWNGYMDGAISSGRRAADEALATADLASKARPSALSR